MTRPPSWQQLINSNRLGNRSPNEEPGRSPFNKDHDRISFAGAFRRLAKKTQVHPLAQNDHVHNRLTHSLEVACVGRTLGIKVGQHLEQNNLLAERIIARDIGDIVEAACLAHDIGNPPFGHTGEEAIREWFSANEQTYLKDLDRQQRLDFLHWEGNAQGLRVLTTSEYHPYAGGMHLTYSTLAAGIKYPWGAHQLSDHAGRPKFGAFYHETPYLVEIAEQTGLLPLGPSGGFHRHPLVLLVEAADDFCYGIIDMEDGYEMGILDWDELLATTDHLLSDTDKEYVALQGDELPESRRLPLLRGKIIARCVDAAAKAFNEHEAAIRAGIHSDLIALCDDAVVEYVQKTKTLAREKIFRNERKATLEIGAYGVISELLSTLCKAALEYSNASTAKTLKHQRVIDLLGFEKLNIDFAKKAGYSVRDDDALYFYLMRVMDYLSGMTDPYAMALNKKFRGID